MFLVSSSLYCRFLNNFTSRTADVVSLFLVVLSTSCDAVVPSAGNIVPGLSLLDDGGPVAIILGQGCSWYHGCTKLNPCNGNAWIESVKFQISTQATFLHGLRTIMLKAVLVQSRRHFKPPNLKQDSWFNCVSICPWSQLGAFAWPHLFWCPFSPCPFQASCREVLRDRKPAWPGP